MWNLLLYSLVVVLCHLLLILDHSLRSLVSDFVQTIQIQFQLVVIALFVKEFHPRTSEPYFNEDNYFCAICQVEGCFFL